MYATFGNCLTFFLKKLECAGNDTLVDVTRKYRTAYFTVVC